MTRPTSKVNAGDVRLKKKGFQISRVVTLSKKKEQILKAFGDCGLDF